MPLLQFLSAYFIQYTATLLVIKASIFLDEFTEIILDENWGVWNEYSAILVYLVAQAILFQ